MSLRMRNPPLCSLSDAAKRVNKIQAAGQGYYAMGEYHLHGGGIRIISLPPAMFNKHTLFLPLTSSAFREERLLENDANFFTYALHNYNRSNIKHNF
jgi:hypothetical protein